MTSPLPKTRRPVLKKKRKSFIGTIVTGTNAGAATRRETPGEGGGGDGRGVEGGTTVGGEPVAGLAKTNAPRMPATTKRATSSFWMTIVTPNATRKKAQAMRSRRRVFLPRFQHALTISATTTGPTP